MVSLEPRRSFDSVARLAQHLGGGRSATVGICDEAEVVMLGKNNVSWNRLPANWSLALLAGQSKELAFVPNVTRDARMRRHPIVMAMPTLRKLLYVPFDVSPLIGQGGIVVFDPSLRWPLLPDTTRFLIDLGALAADLVYESSYAAGRFRRGDPCGFAEGSESAIVSPDPVAGFLLATLCKRQNWRTRGGHGFATVRRWRVAIKKHQISAMLALKESAPRPFVDAVAAELAAAAKSLLGASNIDSVVNVPCGHSSSEHCFSQLLAEAVSKQLSVPYVNAFARQARPGKSHPRRNKTLKPFEIVEKPKGTVLLIDDIASSGRHLEQAMAALEPHVDHVAALAWIGDN